MVFVQQKFSGTKLAVVVEAHGMTVSTRVVDDEDVAFVDFWQIALDGEFVAVFAEAADDIVYVIVWCVFFAKNSDVVISAIHPWTHEVCHAGVHTDVVAIGVFVMNSGGNEVAIRASYHTTAFKHDL